MGLASERGKVVEVALQGAEVARVRHLLVEPIGERSPEATELPQAGVELGPVRVHHPQQGRHLRIGQSSARLQLPEDDVKLRGGMIVAPLCVPTPLQDGGGQALAKVTLDLGIHAVKGGVDVMAPTTIREALRVVFQAQLMSFYGHHLVPHVILRRHRGLEVLGDNCDDHVLPFCNTAESHFWFRQFNRSCNSSLILDHYPTLRCNTRRVENRKSLGLRSCPVGLSEFLSTVLSSC